MARQPDANRSGSAESTPRSQGPQEAEPGLIQGFFRDHGLAFVMVASYFGSGSIFIASSAGVRFGYGLIWAVIVATVIGFLAQDMSARLGICGEPLMTFVRRRLGKRVALAIALWLTVGCIAWTLELTAAVGAGVSQLLGGAIGWQPIAIVTGIAAIIAGIRGYESLEHLMTGMMFTLLVIYLVVAAASRPDLVETVQGLIPGTAITAGGLTLVAGILGTTALWPNFFLESILVREKGWTDVEDVPVMRRDLVWGYAVGGIITVAVLVVAATLLRPLGYTQLDSFLTPGFALAEVLGEWAMILFVVGAVAAAFNSIVPIMWAPSYMIPEAIGHDPDSNSREFKKVFIITTAIGTLSPVVHWLTGLTVIEMIILFPTFNGIFGLPLTVLLLVWAVNDREIMGDERNGPWMNIVAGILLILSFGLAILSFRGFVTAVTGG